MMYDFLNIDKSKSSFLYEQIYDNIKTAVKDGKLCKGDKLPSIRKLAEDLDVSRTSVETAYDQLCAEGYVRNIPKKGFFIEAENNFNNSLIELKNKKLSKEPPSKVYKYDFSSSSIDPKYMDIKFWKRCVKDVLDRHYIISSYGQAQGELSLREALCDYSRSVREVDADSERILIGAGTQALLTVLLGLCGEYGKEIAIEKGFFPQGEQIFLDFGFNLVPLKADKNGIILDDSVKSRIIFVNPSGSIRGASPIPINKRMEIIRWAQENDAIIIEDDFNGELRYTSRPVPALQGICSDRVVYIGSFSKLLIPSVRISYMVLPKHLSETYSLRKQNYNQTSSKIEQLALADYIKSGRLERQLRKLRKLYAVKSNILSENLKNKFPEDTIVEVVETALCVRIKLRTERPIYWFKNRAEENEIKLGKCREKNGVKYFYLCFSGIETEKIPDAVDRLRNAWEINE